MTDEEMAEEYADNYDIMNRDLSPKSPRHIVKECFLAGLKAGRPKWHKVADGDLPKEYTEVLNDDGVKVIRINEHWRYVYGDEWEDDAYVDHWCEIPEYKE